jgi:hypothetical protein
MLCYLRSLLFNSYFAGLYQIGEVPARLVVVMREFACGLALR